jgi:hypothetical protein
MSIKKNETSSGKVWMRQDRMGNGTITTGTLWYSGGSKS